MVGTANEAVGRIGGPTTAYQVSMVDSSEVDYGNSHSMM